MIRILLADDHPVLRFGIRALLDTQSDFAVVAETGEPAEAALLAAHERADVALVDLDFGRDQPDGAATTRMILQASPTTRVIAFTAFDADTDIVRMVEAGAVGYLVKDSRPAALFSAIRQAADGAGLVSGTITQRLFDRTRDPQSALTARELEVLELAANGLSNRELAQRLLVSEATIKSHLHHAFTKLGADNRQAAIAAALRQGIIRL
ncbi:response regulator [Leucobacter sp. HY1910]